MNFNTNTTTIKQLPEQIYTTECLNRFNLFIEQNDSIFGKIYAE